VGGGGGDGGVRWAVGDGSSARCDGNNISNIGGAFPGHSGTGEESGNNGELHLD
jgi:hypothetical protein